MTGEEFYALRNDPLLEKVVYGDSSEHLAHQGIQGQKKGVRRFQTYDGKYTPEGIVRYGRRKNPTVFISGSSKTQFEDSGYYRKELPKEIQNKIEQYMNEKKTILVGDAPGIDRQVQDFLNDRGYMDVEVYSPGKKVRYSANEKWNTNLVDVPDAEEGSGEWLRGKDEAMTNRADEGLAVILDEGAKATRNNIERLGSQNKKCDVFQLNKNGKDKWVKHSVEDDEGLKHHGRKNQRWGVRNGPPYPLNAEGNARFELRNKNIKAGQRTDTDSGMSQYAGFKNKAGESFDFFEEVHWGNNSQTGRGWYNPTTFRKERYMNSFDPDTLLEDRCGQVNPDYGSYGTTNNCTKCSATGVLGLMGYKFEAGRSNCGFGEAFDYWFDGAKNKKYKDVASCLDDFESKENGSFGTFDMRNVTCNAGHVINWQKKSDGSYAVVDNQCGEKYRGKTMKEALDGYFGNNPQFDRYNTINTYDMTHAKPNWDHMAEDSVVRMVNPGDQPGQNIGIRKKRSFTSNNPNVDQTANMEYDYRFGNGTVFDNF